MGNVIRASLDYTATSADSYIGYSALAAARTVTLPAISTCPSGYTIEVKDEIGLAGTNNITVEGSGDEEIQGETSLVISANYGGVVLSPNGTEWVTRGTEESGGGPTTKVVTLNLPGTGMLVDQSFFIADRAYLVTAITEVHAVAGDDTDPVNLQVTKDTTTDAPGAGTNLLTNNTDAGFDLKGTANTVQNGTLTETVASLQLAAGNRLSVDFAGVLTTLAGIQLTVALQPI